MDTQEIEIGSIIKLQHATTKRFLRESNCLSENDDDQPVIVATERREDADDWQVEGTDFKSWPKTGPLIEDNQICLRNCRTQRRLHAHYPRLKREQPESWPKPFFWPRKEVTGFLRSSDGVGDANDPWRLKLVGNDSWKADQPFMLEHVAPSPAEEQELPKFLHSNNVNMKHEKLGGENGVACQKTPDEDSEWVAVAHRSRNEFRDDRIASALRTNESTLDLRRLGLTNIPASIANLTSLRALNLSNNCLRELPEELAGLEGLQEMSLLHNPLNPELAAIYSEGTSAVKRYLRELAKGARKHFEAKLLILGDGDEGKTCVSRALRGLPFRKQKTTRGVDVEQWKFAHPDDVTDRAKDITLNVWDFEGQEISHQTHQFFLKSESLYLLVFKCREQFRMDRAEYWLDTIHALAPKAKVAIVISECETRMPFVPLDQLKAQFGNMFAAEWFFTVGCKNRLNIAKLQSFLQHSAADLEFMGSRRPTTYDNAEKEIRAMAKAKTAHVSRGELHAIFARAGVSNDSYGDAATAMERVGVITQFPDRPDLSDFVVLRPQWLTKAISKVIEDESLSRDKGEITLKRMEDIWNEVGYRGMFATFHNCMKEFELCYDLEGRNQSCLLPLRFGYERPIIPWSSGEGLRQRRLEYKLNIRPPMGIMSRFIVKTHHLIVKTTAHPKGVYWRNGVFLQTGEGPLRSEALCEFVPEERKLRIEVRAAFPQNMCEQIHAYVKAVFSFFSGLDAERSYGCIVYDPDWRAERQCVGLHTEKRIFAEIVHGGVLNCEFSMHNVDPKRLIWGFGSFGDDALVKKIVANMRSELDREPGWATPFLRGVTALLHWLRVNSGKLDQVLHGQAIVSAEFKQEMELKLHEYLETMSKMLDDRDHTAAPGLISIMTNDRSGWNPAGYFKQAYILTPYCECEGNIHACTDGTVEFTKDKAWWEKWVPRVARGTKWLAAGLQLAITGMPIALGAGVAEGIKDELDFMKELSGHLELEMPVEKEQAEKVIEGVQDLRGEKGETAATRAALERMLEEVAPDRYRAKRWGSLRRVRMSNNSYRWLCEECAKGGR